MPSPEPSRCGLGAAGLRDVWTTALVIREERQEQTKGTVTPSDS